MGTSVLEAGPGALGIAPQHQPHSEQLLGVGHLQRRVILGPTFAAAGLNVLTIRAR